MNLKNNPELEKYIDYETIGGFLKYNQFYSETKSGKAYKADKTTFGSTFYKAQGTVPTTIIHEIFHALTQREFDKHITKKKLHGKQLYDLYKLKSKDQSLPEPIREILRVYLKAVDYGDKYLQYRPLNLPNSTRLIKPTERSRNITKLMSTNPDKAGGKQFYGLANIDEFCTMSIMSPEFQQWLRTIPDPEALSSTGEVKSLWDKFTKLITDLLNSLSKPLEGELSGLTLFDSSVKSIMEVAAMSGDIDRSMFEDNPVDSWKTIKGASAAKAEAETLRKGKKEEFIEKNGLNLPPINREILSGVYKYEPEEASGTTSTATVATYENLYDFIENKAYGKSLQEYMADYNVLDWGSGRGGGAEKLKQMIAEGGRYGDWRAKQRIKLESYEPFFVEGKGRTAPSLKRKPRKETQDLIINSQVVNVIPADERAQLLQDIYASLKEEGQAIITTRTPSQITKSISEKTLKVVGPAEYISYVDGKATTYQKGFSAKSLKKFIEEVLPEADVVANGLDIGPTHVVITKPKGAGIELDSDPEESIQYSKIKTRSQKNTEYLIKKEFEEYNKIFTPKKLQELKQIIEKEVPPEIIYGLSTTPYTLTFRRAGHIKIQRFISRNFSDKKAIKIIERITGEPNSAKALPPRKERVIVNKEIGARTLKDFMKNYFDPYLREEADSKLIKLIEDNVPENIIEESKNLNRQLSLDLFLARRGGY